MAATITITIHTDGAAFCDDDPGDGDTGTGVAAAEEVCRILRQAAARHFSGGVDLCAGLYSLRDTNGNRCGQVEIAADGDEDV